VYYDDTTDERLLMCDLCAKFFVFPKNRSAAKLLTHRNTTECLRRVLSGSKSGWKHRNEGTEGTAVRDGMAKYEPPHLCMLLHTRYLVDHVTLWMPALIPHIAINFDKLFEDGAGAAGAFRGEAG
jgi:hypothetical protein